MNGIHDLGGMDGFTLPDRDQGPALNEEWERQVWGLLFALSGVPGLPFGGRRVIEAMPPDLYLSTPYYARWLYAREQTLLASGLVTEEELSNPDGPITIPDLPGFQPATPEEIVQFLSRDDSEQLDVDVAPQFTVGDAVVVKNEHPAGHTRVPRYVRDHEGIVIRDHGPHRFPDDLPADVELGPQHLYTVEFAATELWGSRGHPNDRIHVELWEYHLAPAT